MPPPIVRSRPWVSCMVRRSTSPAASRPAWSAIRWTSFRSPTPRCRPRICHPSPLVSCRDWVPGADEPDGEDHSSAAMRSRRQRGRTSLCTYRQCYRRDRGPSASAPAPVSSPPRDRSRHPAAARPAPTEDLPDADGSIGCPKAGSDSWWTAPGLLLVGAFVLPPILASRRLELLPDRAPA